MLRLSELNYNRPDCIREPGRNVYAPKIIVLFEDCSFRAVVPLMAKLCWETFKEYEHTQIYYDFFRQTEPCEHIETARIFGARLCYVYHAMDHKAWLLVEAGQGILGRVTEYDAMQESRFFRDLRRPVSEMKPTVKELCSCGLCDQCLGL